MRVWSAISGLILLVSLSACDRASGRDAAFGGVGPKGDDPNAGGDGTALLDGEMIALLEQANNHLGDPSDWPDDDAGNAGGGSCADHCGSTEAKDGCYCDPTCVENNDCCSDYQAKCGGNDDGGNDDGGNDDGGNADGGNDDGGNDDGGNDDGGTTPSSCSGACGSSEIQNDCYCDDTCESNGDCCSDYQALCGGGSNDAGDDGGGDDGGTAATCAGACGEAGLDGSCWCDTDCTENGDCCTDYAELCAGAAPPVEPTASDDLWTPANPVAVSKACIKVLDGKVNMAKILTAAGKGAAAHAGACFAVALIPTAASAGTVSPVTSVICLLAGGGGGALGAAKSYIIQKRSDIAVCTAETVATVLTAIVAASENIGVFEMEGQHDANAKTEGLKDKSLECTGSYTETAYHDDSACGPVGNGPQECWQVESCEDVRKTTERWARCRWARIVAANTKWGGEPNGGHLEAILRAKKNEEDCIKELADTCSMEEDPWSDADESKSKQDAKDLICN